VVQNELIIYDDSLFIVNDEVFILPQAHRRRQIRNDDGGDDDVYGVHVCCGDDDVQHPPTSSINLMNLIGYSLQDEYSKLHRS